MLKKGLKIIYIVKYDKRYVYDVDLQKIKEKKNIITDFPSTMNKYLISDSFMSTDEILQRNNHNELNFEDKMNLIKNRNNLHPSTRYDVKT